MKDILERAKKTDLGFLEKKKRIVIDLIMIAVGILWIFTGISLFTNKETSFNAEFIKCIDGDTVKLEVNYKEESVRLLAVDTPEIDDYYYKEASEFTCDKIKNAEKIKVEIYKDSKKYDKYERLLAFVYIDGVLLQEELVEKGYAKVAYLYDDYKYTENLLEKEKEAQNKKLGIWVNN